MSVLDFVRRSSWEGRGIPTSPQAKRRLRALLSSVLAVVLMSALLVVPVAASSGGQKYANVSLNAGGLKLSVVGQWVNPADATQDGSQARPFTPGSRLKLRIDVSGSGLPQLRFISGGFPNLGGAARGMSAGASHYAYLNESDPYNASANSVAHIAIPVGSVSGGLATWSLDRAALALTMSAISSYGRFTETTKYALSRFGGTFHIAASPPPVVNNVAVTAQLADVEVTDACRNVAPNATHQVQLELTVKNGSTKDLEAVRVDGYRASVVPSPGSVTSGVLVVEQGVIFGTVGKGESKQGDEPAAVYCLTVPAGSTQSGKFALSQATILGYPTANSVRLGEFTQKLSGLSGDFSVNTPAPEPAPEPTPAPEPEVEIPEPEGTLPEDETETNGGDLDESDSGTESGDDSDPVVVYAQLEKLIKDAVTKTEVAAAMKALTDQRAERTQQALSAFVTAREKFREAKADGLTAAKLTELEDEKNAAKREWKKARRHRNNVEARFEAADTAAKAATDVLEQAVESYTCTLETVICNVLIDSLQQIVDALNSDERLVLPQ